MFCFPGCEPSFCGRFSRSSTASLRARVDEHEWSRPSHDPRRAAKAQHGRTYRDLVQRLPSFLPRQPGSPPLRAPFPRRSGQRKTLRAQTDIATLYSPACCKTAKTTTGSAATKGLAGGVEFILESATNSTALSRQVRAAAREKNLRRRRHLVVRLLQSPTCCSRLASDSERSILSQEFLSCNPEGAEEFVFSPNGPHHNRNPRDCASPRHRRHCPS